jgi:dTDP-4-dehydrorhamnose reductase
MSKIKLPLLITGLPGVHGYNCFYYFRKQLGDEVIGIKPAHTVELEYPGVYGISAEHTEALERLFSRYQFKTVIDASGCCALKSCEYNPQLAAQINCEFGTSISIQARQHKARLIRFSTDLVFDGSGAGHYKEEDRICPITVYGKTMAQAEAAILSEHDHTAIFRIPLPMGPSLNGHAGAVDWIEHRFAKGNPATLYYDEVRSNLYIQDVIAVVEQFIEDFRPGIFHLGGPLPLTLYEIGQIVNKLGNYDAALLHGSLRQEAGPIPPRVGNVTMDSSKLLRLLPPATIKPWPVDEIHLPTGKDWHFHREKHFPVGALKAALYGYDNDMDLRSPLNWFGNPEYFVE